MVKGSKKKKWFPLLGRRVRINWKEEEGNFWSDRTLLHFDRDVDYIAVCFCQNSSNI